MELVFFVAIVKVIGIFCFNVLFKRLLIFIGLIWENKFFVFIIFKLNLVLIFFKLKLLYDILFIIDFLN